MLETRLTEVETKLAYQEHTVQVLDEVVTRQQKQIEQLQLLCRQLLERVQSTAEPGGTNTVRRGSAAALLKTGPISAAFRRCVSGRNACVGVVRPNVKHFGASFPRPGAER